MRVQKLVSLRSTMPKISLRALVPLPAAGSRSKPLPAPFIPLVAVAVLMFPPSQEPRFGEAPEAVGGDDHVVEQRDAEGLAAQLQAGRDLAVLAARRGVAGRMVVDDHDRGGIA